MPRKKTRKGLGRNMLLKLRPVDDAALDAVTGALKLDNNSSTLRFLVHEKARELGLYDVIERVAARDADPPPPESVDDEEL